MLSPDFYTIVTTSDRGTTYNASASRSHGKYGTAHESQCVMSKNHCTHSTLCRSGPSIDSVHAICRSPSEEFHLTGTGISGRVRLQFPICTPSKASRQTLDNPGSLMGLSPSGSLARLSSPSFLDQLVDQGVLKHKVWSVALLDTEIGILSLGRTMAREVEETKIRVETELKHFGDEMGTSEWVKGQVEEQMKLMMPPDSAWDDHFKWTNVQGAAGWWTALMAGVWINGAKVIDLFSPPGFPQSLEHRTPLFNEENETQVLKNQPILLDINVPFILAPPVATQRFYESIGGTKRLPAPYDAFFAFPCLNPVNIAFEIGGWNFPTMNGEGTSSDALYGPAGGRFSLGKLADGTGYCVGSVVESRRMGMHKEWAGSGLRDVWVLGEPFFRGLGVAFDAELGRVGVRTY